MSKLQNLIDELCPNGVEYKTIGEIAIDIYRGAGIKREDVTKDGIPCVRYGEIYTQYDIWFEQCLSHTKLEAVPSPKYFEHGDILFAITGESVEEIAKSCAYIGHDKCLAGGDIVIVKHNQNPKYLAYALSTTSAQIQKSAGKVKSKVVHSNVPSIKGIRVPIPPLPVQQEIVRILDAFTELTAEITDKLTAELAARRKQYEYYRDKLLTFNNDEIVPPPGKIWKLNGLQLEIFAKSAVEKLFQKIIFMIIPDCIQFIHLKRRIMEYLGLYPAMIMTENILHGPLTEPMQVRYFTVLVALTLQMYADF